MANATIHVDVVSAEESIYSGEAEFVVLPGEAGELGIYPRHTPLITRIKHGAVRITPAGGGEEQLIFVAGECDALPEQAFYMVGAIEEAFEKAKTLK